MEPGIHGLNLKLHQVKVVNGYFKPSSISSYFSEFHIGELFTDLECKLSYYYIYISKSLKDC